MNPIPAPCGRSFLLPRCWPAYAAFQAANRRLTGKRLKSPGAELSFSSVSVRRGDVCALSPISPFFWLLAGLAALRAANRRQIRETLEKPRSKAQLFGRFCASGMRRGFFLPGKTVARRGQAARNSRVRARRGEEKDTVRDLPGAAALEKAKEQSSAFRAFLCVGDAPELSPCPGKQELSAGTHPERTACVRGSNADTNTVRVLPTAGARACETRGGKRHDARLARRSRARKSQGAKLSFSSVSVRYIQPPLSGDLPADRRRPGNGLHGV